MKADQENERDFMFDKMKKRIMDSFGLSYETKQHLTCYSRRKKSDTGRAILNEKDFLPTLEQKFNLRILDFTNTSIQDQIKISKDCDVFIGPHGQNLQMATFMKEGSHLVELFPQYIQGKNVFHANTYFQWTGLAGFSYDKIYCNDTVPNNRYPYFEWKRLNLYCSLESILEILNKLL